MNTVKRHIAKSISWRIIGTIDTFLLSYVLTGSISFGLSISGVDFFIKLLLYYFHERIWFLSKIRNTNKRHLFKTFSWRFVGSLATLIVAWIVTDNPFTGLEVGLFETLTKIILYYLHEKTWYRINFGLPNRNTKYVD
ncbi:DUF2061 domain-containing protein [Flavobacteriaceae bacterium]|nr:DUF2061 domain-containing protein [Flavobacteriaceae bacterium]